MQFQLEMIVLTIMWLSFYNTFCSKKVKSGEKINFFNEAKISRVEMSLEITKKSSRVVQFSCSKLFYCKNWGQYQPRQTFWEQQGEYFTAHLPQTWMLQAGSQQHFFQSQKAECKRRTFIYLFVHSAGEHRHQYKCQDSISPPLDIFAECLSWFPAASTQPKSSTPTSPPLAEAVICKTTPLWTARELSLVDEWQKNKEIKRVPPL